MNPLSVAVGLALLGIITIGHAQLSEKLNTDKNTELEAKGMTQTVASVQPVVSAKSSKNKTSTQAAAANVTENLSAQATDKKDINIEQAKIDQTMPAVTPTLGQIPSITEGLKKSSDEKLISSKYSAELQKKIVAATNSKALLAVQISYQSQYLKSLTQLLRNLNAKPQSQVDNHLLVQISAGALRNKQLAEHKGVIHVASQGMVNANTIGGVPEQQEHLAESAVIPTTGTNNLLADVNFSFATLQAITTIESKVNIAVSPYSLGQIGLAALLASQQPEQLKRPVWFFPQLNSSKMLEQFKPVKQEGALQAWNTLWFQKGDEVNSNFSKNYQSLLAGNTIALNLKRAKAASDQINRTIAKQTNQRIKKLLNNSDLEQAEAVLTNAVFFKAKWKVPFNTTRTRDLNFNNMDGRVVLVPTMRDQRELKWAQQDGWTLVELLFANDQTKLHLLLAPESNSKQIPDATVYSQLVSALQLQSVHLELPKVQLEGMQVDLTSIIPDLNQWTLDQLIDGRVLTRLKGIHQASIEWDETGAEAAAATTIIAKRSLEVDQKPTVKFNRPFYFLISENNQILFAGGVRQLQSKEVAKLNE